MEYKEIVCLANSYKLQQRCIAGKDIEHRKWIRPVSSSAKGELTIQQISYHNGEIPRLLDIIRIPFEDIKPLPYQPENILISSERWEKIGVFPDRDLESLCDFPKTIWVNHEGYNDRIPLDYFEKDTIESSLLLIKPNSLKISQEFKTRAIISYNSIEYNLGITDPLIKEEFNKKSKGLYEIDSKNVYMCISLGEPYNPVLRKEFNPGMPKENFFCYKLVASIICIDKDE